MNPTQHNGTTFFSYIEGGGDGVIAAYDHDSGLLETNTVFSGLDTDADDHSPPTLLIRNADNRIIAFASEHHDDTLRWKISDDPEDISSFGSESTTTTTKNGLSYPQPTQLANEDDKIRVFYRSYNAKDDREWRYVESTDDGDTFGNEQTLRENFVSADYIVNPYTLPYSDEKSQIHFLSMNYEQIAEGGTPNDIYHWYYEDGEFFETDGTYIKDEGNPLTSSDEPTTIDPSNDVNLWDIALDSNGNPIVVYVKYKDYDTSHVYRYGHWDGSEWSTHEIVDSGGPLPEADGREWYSYGVRLNQSDPSIVYAAEEESDGVGQIYKYSTNDDGETWIEETTFVESPSQKHFRPRYPRNASEDDIEVFWLTGDYDDLRDWDCGIHKHP